MSKDEGKNQTRRGSEKTLKATSHFDIPCSIFGIPDWRSGSHSSTVCTPQAQARASRYLAQGVHEPSGLLHPLQEAFWETHGLQCGFCTPGFLMTLLPFLEENADPSEDEIREAISGNLCRCTGYQHIVDSARLAAERMHGG